MWVPFDRGHVSPACSCSLYFVLLLRLEALGKANYLRLKWSNFAFVLVDCLLTCYTGFVDHVRDQHVCVDSESGGRGDGLRTNIVQSRRMSRS